MAIETNDEVNMPKSNPPFEIGLIANGCTGDYLDWYAMADKMGRRIISGFLLDMTPG